MLKLSRSSDLALRDDNNEFVRGGGDIRNLSKFKKSKNAKSRIQMCIKTMRKLKFLTPSIKKAFNQLK